MTKEACDDLGYVDSDVHFGARCYKPDWNFLGACRSFRHARLKKDERLDRTLSRIYGVDERGKKQRKPLLRFVSKPSKPSTVLIRSLHGSTA
jgi:hypothetical protein